MDSLHDQSRLNYQGPKVGKYKAIFYRKLVHENKHEFDGNDKYF